jgi:hypothetical protein
MKTNQLFYTIDIVARHKIIRAASADDFSLLCFDLIDWFVGVAT